MNELLLTLVAMSLVWALYRWGHRRSRRDLRQRKAQGYRLIHARNSYSAWLNLLRSEALADRVQDQLAWPEALLRAREIVRLSFPALSAQLLRLLEGDSRLMGTIWQQELRRLTQPAQLFVSGRDPDYQQFREDQEMLIQEMIACCREMIGDSVNAWRRTGAEFDFSSGSGLTSPVSSA